MIYVDTSVLVALIVNEPRSSAVGKWYAGARSELVSAVWCVTEFASALGIKQRTAQLDARQAQAAWERFGRLAAHDLRLLPLDPALFERAAMLTLESPNALRAGDALHLACAERCGARRIATLDDKQGRDARSMSITPVRF
ncbi:MAG: type II toxin-antitoxin system VapC family toxin [Burkholderiaceae bacterium]|nr:type II toxin-antitoxin system VapC family toxin [Burkholderiaceae bacterium]